MTQSRHHWLVEQKCHSKWLSTINTSSSTHKSGRLAAVLDHAYALQDMGARFASATVVQCLEHSFFCSNKLTLTGMGVIIRSVLVLCPFQAKPALPVSRFALFCTDSEL